MGKRKKIKILHAPVDTGGQAWGVSRAERSFGYRSDCVIFKSSWINYRYDYNLNLNKKNLPKSFFKMLIFFLSAIKKYDVFHFYFGWSLLPFNLDLPILRIFRKKIFFTFQGCDIRQSKYCNACKECEIASCRSKFRDLQKSFKTKFINFFAHKTFVLSPDLCFFSPSSEMIPYASVDLDEWKPLQIDKKNDLITVIHAPTNRSIKGTKYIGEAVLKLKKEGYPVELKLIENIPHDKAKTLYLKADIAVDQLLIGWYGAFAVEMMALGKPVISYLNKDFLVRIPWGEDIPIINANPETIYDKLKWLIENPEKRVVLGQKGREFAEKYHDPIKLARKLIQYYEQ